MKLIHWLMMFVVLSSVACTENVRNDEEPARELRLDEVEKLAAGDNTQDPLLQPKGNQASSVNTRLGIEYMRQGRNEVALKKLLKALSQDDRNSETHNALGVLYERLGRLESAERHFQSALRIAPGDSSAHNNFGTYLCRQKRISEAEQHFVRAVTNPLYETPELAYTNAGNCFRRDEQLEKAELYLQKALRSNAKFAPALYHLGELRFHQQRYLEVRDLLADYEKIAPHTPQTLDLAIRTEHALGDKDAQASYEVKLRGQFPDSQEAQNLSRH